MNDVPVSGAVDDCAIVNRAHLERIADLLGCPVAAFYTSQGIPAGLAARHELLDLWDALRTDASREAVLKLIRAIVEKE